ncbi:MAG: hypothetical protein EBS74_01650 [Flavobacteriia bacterium]|nr:hypothetical protein [Flavobacteriia bacterium]
MDDQYPHGWLCVNQIIDIVDKIIFDCFFGFIHKIKGYFKGKVLDKNVLAVALEIEFLTLK